ncbi:uncharacterized protein LOC110431229 isoform X1 [Sorghum bicolor]|uniref:uncharacterized protein LOC110431229 isoform X1 n=1 Tax=Sorghum bicolor TaxID=4558 RepID=UPI000B424DF7|nr:uncharacterized protein LOC110431229 isoform X1 [Sorghum bicolor]XP_021305695.1 uncharacterized protein LOC110431229 isoform X1 [Sorghum bicolor]XP_021305696.1 uncharacterized protein LOC110431229 isoform X1 [Sorghum bicolor]XP_021305697.1 uncharacterized protein LOC110431229 isoform X1 [Sorghum bicolor]|eukprot:XP_021305694.1 uncharacterized protein LOC110431229 isoform X1 [Sorghum bicolor]
MHAVAVCLEMVGEQSASRRLQACSDRQSFMLSRRLWAQCCDILYLTGSGSARTRNSLGLTRPQPRASGEGAVESSVGQSVIPSACALAADSISPSPEPQEVHKIRRSALLSSRRVGGAETGKQYLDMLLDILPNQDNPFRRPIDAMLCHGTFPWIYSFGAVQSSLS